MRIHTIECDGCETRATGTELHLGVDLGWWFIDPAGNRAVAVDAADAVHLCPICANTPT